MTRPQKDSTPDQAEITDDSAIPDVDGESGVDRETATGSDHEPAETDPGSDTEEGSSTSGLGGTIRDRVESQLNEKDSTTSVFANKDLVHPDTIIDANRIVGRDEQLDRIIELLLPAVKGGRQDNILQFGPSGTGKSLIINATAEEVATLCENRGVDFGVIRINCQRISSEDKAVYAMLQDVSEKTGAEIGIKKQGTATSDKYDRLYEIVNERFEAILFILDEIDYLTGNSNDDEPDYSRLLYQLSRATAEGDIEGRSAVAALTNDTQLIQKLDGRTASSFNPDNVVFPDYDATQIRAILEHREDAFRDGVLSGDVIPLAAAFAAQDEGDARKAIDLLRKAGEMADREGSGTVEERHVRTAQGKLDVDQAQKTINGLSAQKKYTLYALTSVAVHATRSLDSIPGPVAYEVYSYVTDSIDAVTKSDDSFRRYAKELASYNIISKDRSGRGRGRGVHNEYAFAIDPETVEETIERDSRITETEQDSLQLVVESQLDEFNST
ncbi:Cdc6/Cdc18 family protein [Halorussus halobius]|uniref:Cdc6/Cdc18 family protein n=1 Tax=Halorussus halobius TaxID=1710537 RepID=UPI001091A5B6|nr:AAA family ATPase [Halorussus halobius]